MLILEDLTAEVRDTNAFHWHLGEHSQQNNTNAVLMYGYNAPTNTEYGEHCRDFKRKIFFNNWSPCEFAQARGVNDHDAFSYDDGYDQVYSICPYTNKWLNSLGLDKQYRDIFYPFHTSIIPSVSEKKYDVIYHGGIHGPEHFSCLYVMREVNYRYVRMTHSINENTMQCLKYATNTNLSFHEKIDLVAQTKVSVCYNFVHINPEHIPHIKSYDNWHNNEAFSEVGKWNIMPQFKTRMHEAAISRTLNLVQRDRWNIAEKYYEPERDFVYFENDYDLKNKIDHVLQNWESYQEVIENAYNKAMLYTTEKFVDVIRQGEEW